MKEKTKTKEPLEEAAASDRETVASGTAIPDSYSNILRLLYENFGISGETPDEVERSLRKRSVRSAIESKAKAAAAEKRYRARLAEADKLKKQIEGFELERELKDPVFKKLIRIGFDLETSYKFTHFDELMEKNRLAAEQAGYEKAVALLRKGQLRPEENGTREQSGITEKKNVHALTGGGIRAILSRVENGAKVKF